MDKLTNLPQPSAGSKEAIAFGIIDEVLNFALNRHVHVLEENGYLNARQYHTDYGWEGGKKKKALALKHGLMDEVQLRFAKEIARKLGSHAEEGGSSKIVEPPGS
jgi:hypothetical protein